MNRVIKYSDKVKIYYLSYFLYNLARVLPHAVLTVILLNKGMTVGNIAFIQGFFMLAVLLFEFPSGIITDIWSEKKIYIMSLGLLALSYFIIIFSDSLIPLCMSWFVYGISSAAISGSLETYFLRSYDNDGEKIKKFNVNFNNTQLYSGLIGGGIGSFIYKFLDLGLYVISIVTIIVSALIIIFFFKEEAIHQLKKPQQVTEILGTIKQIKNKSIFLSIGLLSAFQIIMQLFFQFWQVMFLNTKISDVYFGLFYILFQIVAIVSNRIFKRFDFYSLKFPLISALSLFLIVSFVMSNKLLFVFSIICFLFPFYIYSNQLVLELQKEAPTKAFSSIVSFSGTVSSVVSLIFLWGVSYFDRLYSFELVSVCAIVIFFLVSSFLIIRSRNQSLYVES
ncbi:MFS transporter [Lactococcus garvieae]|uniref:MFS transporter n=1 Tax=Lactococcus garvieae TaxID=1363 RepID=UPI000693DCDD|nr:MFS transporter [Lactococcus garvieae]MDG6192367.1 MFS transporter [Lactococcus garvieae]PCR98822.1 major facilitator family transporter [Lactococcus garvieae]